MTMENTIHLSNEARALIEKYLVTFAPGEDTTYRQPSNYADTVFLVLDMIKTCVLALGEGRNHGMPGIPQPEVNVSGVLAATLKLLPIEEFNLLDILRESVRNPPASQTVLDDDFCIENIFLTPPPGILN